MRRLLSGLLLILPALAFAASPDSLAAPAKAASPDSLTVPSTDASLDSLLAPAAEQNLERWEGIPVGRIYCTGNKRKKERVVLQEVLLELGKPFDAALAEESLLMAVALLSTLLADH